MNVHRDVLQETLLTFMAKVDTVQDPAMLGPWLRRVTVNTALVAGDAGDKGDRA